MQSKSNRVALGVAATYCLVSGAWIFFSDRILAALVSDPVRITQIQTYKGWVFVGMTGMLLYVTLNFFLRRWEQTATKRKETEAAIQERLRLEAQLSKLAETAPGVIHAYRERPDGTACFPYANPSIENIYGLKPKDLVNDATAALKLIYPDDLGRIKTSVEESARNMSLWRQEFRVCHPQRGEIWVEGCSSPIREPDGSILWQGFLLDITERKRAEEELRWKTAFLEAQVDSALDGVLVVDNQGKKILQNQRLNELWKIPLHINENKDNVAQTEFITARTKNPQQFAEKIAHLNSHPEEISRDEVELIDGTVLERYSSPVLDKSGKHYGRIWTFRDITERRKLEEQFLQSQKMEAIGQLAGGVAHDFNNILTVIQGNASLLLKDELKPAEKIECSSQIIRAAERAAGLTRQLLMFSRKQVIQPEILNLNDVVTQMTKMLRRILGEDVSLQANYAPNLPVIHADAGMIEQVLLNLVVNARDAMPNGGCLTISTGEEMIDEKQAPQHRDIKAGPHIRLTVTDTGGGILPEVLPHIFEPFFTTKEVGKGTGLGLATVYGIVQQHHGWMTVESEVNKGTTFCIYFPALNEAGTRKKNSSTASALPRGNETILVVEDELQVRLFVNLLLQRCGYTVLEAESGAQAIKIWPEHKNEIRLVLTDIIMPDGMTGPELARRLQADKPDLKIIYTSGYSGESAGKGIELVEGVNFLRKPYHPEKLARLLRNTLDARQPAA